MPMKDIINRLGDKRQQQLGEVARFCVVGVTATLLQYLIYWGLLRFGEHLVATGNIHLFSTIAMTVAYAISFAYNFIASTHYTFRVKANAYRGAGFLLSHFINYTLQMLSLNLFLWLGMSKQWAPLPMFCVCVPINFLLVRFFLKR